MPDRRGAGPEGAPLLLVTFLAVTFALAWLAFLPLILGRTDGESATGTLLLVLGIGAPSIAAFVLAAVSAGRGGARRLWRGGTRWRVGVRWYVAVLVIPGLASGAAWAVATALGAETPAFSPPIPALIPARIIFGWIYDRSGGSVLLAVLLHASGNAWSEVLGQGPAVADAAGLTVTLVFWVVAVGVLLRNRRPALAPA